VCATTVALASSAGVVLLLHPQSSSQRDDVTNMAATAAWAEPDARRVMIGRHDRKLLCGLTATVRQPSYVEDGGSGGAVDVDSADRDHRRISFSHFIFRNRMQISQRCTDDS